MIIFTTCVAVCPCVFGSLTRNVLTGSLLGIVLEAGTYNEMMGKPGSELFSLMCGPKKTLFLRLSLTGSKFRSSQAMSAAQSRNASGSATPVDVAGELINGDESPKTNGEKQLVRRKSHRPASFITPEHQKAMAGQSLNQSHKTMQKERSEQGEVKLDVYWQYLKAASLVGGLLYAISIVLQQVASIGESHRIRFGTMQPLNLV